MKILLAGGGTAGHINPALAIAGYIKAHRPGTEFLFIGNKDGMEQRLVPQAGFEIRSISISGFRRGFGPKDTLENIKTVNRTLKSSADAKKIIREFQPDICIGTGGYVSGPVVRTAAKMGIPCLIHEQNAYPGITNKLLYSMDIVLVLYILNFTMVAVDTVLIYRNRALDKRRAAGENC